MKVKLKGYTLIITKNDLEEGFKRTQAGQRKFRKSAILLDMNKEYKLEKLYNELNNGTYDISGYKKIVVYEPKERIVHAPGVMDKIVQFAVHMRLYDIYIKKYVKTSYACILERGTHDAVYKIQDNIRKNIYLHGDAWIIKMDVRKYFYSINRDRLIEVVKSKIKDEHFLELLTKIIESSPEPNGKGIPLGNVTSQDLANIYLDRLDQYIVRWLGLKYHVRYMDDLVIVVESREKAKDMLKKITNRLEEDLLVEFNDKTQIYPAKQGVNALGFRIFENKILLQKKTITNMKSRMKAIDKKVKSGVMTEKEAQQQVNGWLGHAQAANSYNLCKKLFEPYPYIKYDKRQFGRR